ncbi:MAG TPA: hypothetical protein VGY99_09170 [Candidatus Binataceae bacterium]|nr:hypothetical protein [Candidatus Binataceae bacterium]
MDADIVFEVEQAEQLYLVFQAQAGWIAEGKPLAVVMRLVQVLFGDAVGVFESPHLADLLMQQLGERLGAFKRQYLQDP